MTETLERPKHLSPSGAAKYRQCPRAWRFRYIEKRPDPSGEAALVGKFAHSVLEELMKLPAELRTPLSAAAIATKRLGEQSAAKTRTSSPLALMRRLRRSSVGRRGVPLRVSGTWRTRRSVQRGFALNYKVKTTIWGVPFLGIIDRIDQLHR